LAYIGGYGLFRIEICDGGLFLIEIFVNGHGGVTFVCSQPLIRLAVWAFGYDVILSPSVYIISVFFKTLSGFQRFFLIFMC
jgi:hypothetical protein